MLYLQQCNPSYDCVTQEQGLLTVDLQWSVLKMPSFEYREQVMELL